MPPGAIAQLRVLLSCPCCGMTRPITALTSARPGRIRDSIRVCVAQKGVQGMRSEPVGQDEAREVLEAAYRAAVGAVERLGRELGL